MARGPSILSLAPAAIQTVTAAAWEAQRLRICKKKSASIEHADGILIAAPVYNYDVAAATKNMIELTGSAWENKIVGFPCAAGGMGSYMSVMAYANSLMLDFRCVIIPRFVFATSEGFDGENITDKKVVRRIETLADELVRFTKALRT